MSKKDASGGGDGTILVHLRLKPTKKDAGYLGQDDVDQSIVRINMPEKGVSRSDGYVNNSKTQYSFRFNSVLPMKAKQDDVFDVVGKDAVANVLNGINSTIFAYGQTGSGKTFTITGGVDSYEQRGLIPRAISMIFKQARDMPENEYSCHISYLEIYNEQGFDLLDPSHETKALEELPRVTMMTDVDGNAILKNLSTHRANTEEEALNLLFLGDTNRAIAETPMNLASSRSHCLFTVFVESRTRGSDTVRRAKLHLVDLAGSERAHKTGATGQTLREATYINQSLFYLEMVIVALHEKETKTRAHIPYRNSMMTSVLRDSLGGNCKTVMVATVSVEGEQVEESISTCKFAQRVALIKNSAVVNEDLDPTLMIARLKGELSTMREEVAYLRGEAGDGEKLDPDEIQQLHDAVESYCSDPDPYASLQMGKMTLTKLKDTFAIFKNLVLEARNSKSSSSSGSGSGSSSSGGDSSSGGSGTAAGDASVLEEEAAALRQQLKEREAEIAILVNMVKQANSGSNSSRGASAKSGDGSSSGGGGGSGAKGGSGSGAKDDGSSSSTSRSSLGGPPSVGEAKASSSSSNSSNGGVKATAPPPRAPPPPSKVCGVALSADPVLLGDAEQAFEHFRKQWPRAAAIEANKRTLKEKYDLAKELYEKVMASRSTIGYLKKTIEALRRERALANEGLLGDDDHHQGSESGDGYYGGTDSASAAEGSGTGGGGGVGASEEAEAMAKMEREKAIYATCCGNLRDEKAAIEHIQKLMEQGRSKLQSEFDEWYGHCLTAEARHTVRGTHPAPHTATAANNTAASANAAASPGAHHHHGHSAAAAAAPSNEARVSMAAPKPVPENSHGGGGVELTGNKAADDDILAFERAKEELYLLQRRQAQQR